MLRVLLIFCLLYKTQGKPTSLRGNVDIDKELASIFHDIIGYYLNEATKNDNNEININKLVGSFNDFANNHKKEISSFHGPNKDDIRITNINSDPEDEPKNFKKSNVDNDNIKVTREPSHESRKKQRDYRYFTQGIFYEKRKSEKKRKPKNKNDRKEHERKRKETNNTEEEKKEEIIHIERENKEIQEEINDSGRENTQNKEVIRDTEEDKHGKEGTGETERYNERKQEETKDTNKYNKGKHEKIKDAEGENNKNSETSNTEKSIDDKNYENKDIRTAKEKTVLEEMIGMVDSLHIYGKHNGYKDGLPFNNIKA